MPAPPLRAMSLLPIVVAPMAGGPSTPALVIGAGEAGGLGILAGGYKTADAMQAEISEVRAQTHHAFGVNVFVPQSRAQPAVVSRYIAALEADHDLLDTKAAPPVWDDDGWDAKLERLLADPPALVSFTFGCPAPEIVSAFAARDTLVVVTVTRPSEALAAASAGADLLCVQGFEAGAHRGSFTNDDEPGQDYGLLALLAEVRRVSEVPMMATGGITGARGVAAVLAAGAVAAQLGTAFLRCPESGASPVYKAALADPGFTSTAITRAFSGRRARGLVNQFMLDHPDAPPAYPEINNATRPLRTAAARRGDPHRMSLWAGQGFRSAAALPVAAIVEHLAEGV